MHECAYLEAVFSEHMNRAYVFVSYHVSVDVCAISG